MSSKKTTEGQCGRNIQLGLETLEFMIKSKKGSQAFFLVVLSLILNILVKKYI